MMPFLGAATRLTVVGSMLLAVAAGLWPLASQPAVLATLLLVFVCAAVAARRRFAATASVVLLVAYISYGLVRLAGGPALAAMPYWLAAFCGLVIGGVSWKRWQAGDGWRVPLAWWATGVAVSWPMVAARELNYSLEPSLAAGPIVTAALTQMAVALWMDRVLASRHQRHQMRAEPVTVARWAAPLMMSAVITGAAAVYQRLYDLAWLSGEPWTSLQRAVGMMGDANPMGVATALWAPLSFALLSAGGSAGTLLGAPLALLLWAAAWFSGARTSLILVAAGAVALAMAAGVRGMSRRTVIGGFVLAAGALAGLLVAGGPRLLAGTPVDRLLSALPQASPQAALYELLWRRDGYGLAAVEAIREHPLTGVGVGRFAAVSSGYHQRLTGRAIPPDNAQNFWRHMLAEQGLLGLLPILWLTLLSLRSLLSGPAVGEDLVMKVMLAGVGVALLFGYPVQDAAIAVTVGTLVAAVGRARADAF